MKVRIGKIKFKNVTRPSVIPRWASQDIPIIPLVVDNVMARRRHVPYWPKCVFKKVCSRFSEAVRNGCRLMSNQTALIATDKRASVDNMAKMFTTLRMANKSESSLYYGELLTITPPSSLGWIGTKEVWRIFA